MFNPSPFSSVLSPFFSFPSFFPLLSSSLPSPLSLSLLFSPFLLSFPPFSPPSSLSFFSLLSPFLLLLFSFFPSPFLPLPLPFPP
ncbi:hypothetical protein ACXWRS_10100, partial [Streptococcus pyogenes]